VKSQRSNKCDAQLLFTVWFTCKMGYMPNTVGCHALRNVTVSSCWAWGTCVSCTDWLSQFPSC